MEFGTLSFKFISETIRDRGNPSTEAFKETNLHKNWKKNLNSIYLPNMKNFGTLGPFLALRFLIEKNSLFNCPGIHKP